MTLRNGRLPTQCCRFDIELCHPFVIAGSEATNQCGGTNRGRSLARTFQATVMTYEARASCAEAWRLSRLVPTLGVVIAAITQEYCGDSDAGNKSGIEPHPPSGHQ
jgi:hypothetical protein